MSATSSQICDKLIDLLQQELRHYEEIHALGAEEQSVLRLQDPAKQLLPLLERKKTLLDGIARLEAEIAPLKGAWKVSVEREPEKTERIKTLLGGIAQMLRELIDREMQSERALGNRYPGRKDGPGAAGVAGIAVAAYQGGKR